MQSLLFLVAGLVAAVSASCDVPGGLNGVGEPGQGCQYFLCQAPERGAVAICDAPNSCANDLPGTKCVTPQGDVIPAKSL